MLSTSGSTLRLKQAAHFSLNAMEEFPVPRLSGFLESELFSGLFVDQVEHDKLTQQRQQMLRIEKQLVCQGCEFVTPARLLEEYPQQNVTQLRCGCPVCCDKRRFKLVFRQWNPGLAVGERWLVHGEAGDEMWPSVEN